MGVKKFGNELMTDLLAHTVNAIPGCVGLGLSLAKGGDESAAPHSVAAVGVAADLDRAQWSRATGPLWEAFRSGRLVQRPELPEFARPGEATTGELDARTIAAMEAAEGASDRAAYARHLLGLEQLDGVPYDLGSAVRGAIFSTGEWGGELPVVLSVYLDREPDGRALEELDKHEPLLTHALALIEYCSGEEVVAEQMVQMTQYRRVIEQAKGLVMGATGVDANRAFETLARASQHFNVRLRHLAVALVEHVGGAEAEHPDDPELVVRPSPNDREVATRVWAALSAGPILSGDPA
jgi:ANTAR domain-containing protein